MGIKSDYIDSLKKQYAENDYFQHIVFSLVFQRRLATELCYDTLIVGDETYLLNQTFDPIIEDYCLSEGIYYPFTEAHTALY